MVDARTDRSLQAELEEAYALLDVIFARAPVGLALFDATCEGSAARNGFYGDGIIDALNAVSPGGKPHKK